MNILVSVILSFFLWVIYYKHENFGIVFDECCAQSFAWKSLCFKNKNFLQIVDISDKVCPRNILFISYKVPGECFALSI